MDRSLFSASLITLIVSLHLPRVVRKKKKEGETSQTKVIRGIIYGSVVYRRKREEEEDEDTLLLVER